LQLQTKLIPSEVTTGTATTIQPNFTLDFPNTKRFYKQKENSFEIKPSLNLTRCY